MKLQDLNNCGSTPQIYFKPDLMIVNKLDDKKESIKTKMYFFKAILKILVLLKKILKFQNLATVPQMYATTKTLWQERPFEISIKNPDHWRKNDYRL